MNTEIEKFYTLIDEIEIAMMTTRRPDGHLEARAMANQKRMTGADLWFVTTEGTAKLRNIEADPHVNLSYYNNRTREWISVSALASISRDRQKIHALYAAHWSAWFPKEGDPDTALRTIRGWSSSASTSKRPCFSKSTSRNRWCYTKS